MRARFCLIPVAAAAAFALSAALSFSVQAAPAANAALREWPTSSRGDRDVNVRAIQYLRAHHLIAGGEMNDPTWEALVVPLRQGSQGPAVKAAQIELRAEGYAVTVDGRLGPQMKAAVQKLQSRTEHTADGIVGRYTWYELVGGNGSPEAG